MTSHEAHDRVGVREATLVLGLSPDVESIGAVRQRMSAFLELSSLESDDAESVLLVTSELCTNAVQAAPSEPEAEVVVGCRLGEGAVEVEVTNPGDGFEGREPVMPPPEAESGRGLAIVDMLTDRLSVVSRGGRTTVRAIRRLMRSGSGSGGRAEVAPSTRVTRWAEPPAPPGRTPRNRSSG